MRGMLLGFLLLAAAAAPAQAACRTAPAPQVTVRTAFDAVREDFSQSIRDLERIGAESAYTDSNGHEGRLLGLATTRIQIGYKYQFRAERISADRHCVSLVDVGIDFVLRDNVVRVAREIPRGGCLFREVLLHERKHTAANRQLLADYSHSLAEGLRVSARTLGAVAVSDVSAAKQHFERLLEEALVAHQAAFERESRFRHSAIDSRAEYERISNSCDGELRGVLNTASR